MHHYSHHLLFDFAVVVGAATEVQDEVSDSHDDEDDGEDVADDLGDVPAGEEIVDCR